MTLNFEKEPRVRKIYLTRYLLYAVAHY